MKVEIMLCGDASKRATVDAHYARTASGGEYLYTGEYDPLALDRWNAKKLGPPPALFQKDMHSPAAWERTLREVLQADMDDAKMSYRPAAADGEVAAGSPPKGRADRVKP